MASTSSSSSAPVHHKYDVFLSFRGEYTRYSFTGHLYEALHKSGITTFMDDNEIPKGHELKPEIERSITESKASIIVFSENFANSRWCLDELCLILEQKRKVGHIVFPVFYGVDPSDVRNQRGSFKVEAKEGSKWTPHNIERWMAALTEIANLKGMVVSGYEKDFIAKIVDEVHHQLRLEIRSPPTSLTGIDTRAERIISWLRSDQPDHPVLAICAMGGSGKTTLAKHIYYSNKKNFESSSFLEDIGNQPGGLLGVQNKLLRDISGNNNMTISDVYEGALLLEKVIKTNRVLIVIDDIDDKDKLSSLFGSNVFPTQSKIIITTRILNIDTWFESVSWRCHVYKLELLNISESLELLCWHAFGSKVPMEGFEKIAVQLAQYCGGNPLALKVLGSSLFVRNENPMTINNMIEIWRSKMNALNSSKGELEHKIQAVLQRSFESLPCDSHKELFLHIGCFFIGNYAFHVEKILEDDYHASYGIMTLINRCLVTISSNRKFRMHQLLQDMARNIVHEESKDPAKRSRIWRRDEAHRLLSKGDGSETIESLILDMHEMTSEETLKTSSLVKMKNLKFLLLHSVKLTGSFENIPDLRCLWWQKSYFKTIPPGLLMSSLVAIYLISGNLEKFETPTVLYSLKILDLSYSSKLVSICSLHRLPKLEILNLTFCTSLSHVCESFIYLWWNSRTAFVFLTPIIIFLEAYQNHKVDLMGDVITKGRTFKIQMLYEYGIRSTYLQGINDQAMMTYEYSSSSNKLSFCVPMHPKKKKIEGLHVTILYRCGEDISIDPPLAKISNRTKGLTWVYVPVVFCKPRVAIDVVWLSYWPIGNTLDAGDEVHVNIFMDKKIMVKECGVSLVYMDDGEVEKDEKSEMINGQEVIGGDLSSFQVSKGAYYLCRCDLFGSWTPYMFNLLFGDNIECTNTIDTNRWRVSRRSGTMPSDTFTNNFQNIQRWKIEAEFAINFDGEHEIKMIEKTVFNIVGVEYAFTRKEIGRLVVRGHFDPQAVIRCVIQFEKMVTMISSRSD